MQHIAIQCVRCQPALIAHSFPTLTHRLLLPTLADTALRRINCDRKHQCCSAEANASKKKALEGPGGRERMQKMFLQAQLRAATAKPKAAANDAPDTALEDLLGELDAPATAAVPANAFARPARAPAARCGTIAAGPAKLVTVA